MSFLKKTSKKKSNSSLPLVAIDMGSSELRVLAAEPVGDDRFRILGIESMPYESSCIERGIITQPSAMAFQLKKVINILSYRIGLTELPLVFISWGGRGVSYTDVTIRRQLQNRTLTQKDFDDWYQECIDKCCTERLSGFATIPHYFVNDNGPICYGEPQLGGRYNKLRVMFYSFFGPKEIRENVYNCFSSIKTIEIESAFLRSEALLSAFAATDGDIILDEGCAVLDFGAQTTTLFLYKGSSYLCYQVFEQGGADITEHLAGHFNIPTKEAEWIKCEHGVACPEYVEQDKTFTINYADGSHRRIMLTDIAQQIEVVLKTTLAPVYKLLQSYEPQITRLYITGGGSMLGGLDRYLQAGTTLPVLFGSHESVLAPDSDESYYTPTYSSMIGLLLLGQEQRDLHVPSKSDEKSFLEKIRSTVSKTLDTAVDIFSGTNNY